MKVALTPYEADRIITTLERIAESLERIAAALGPADPGRNSSTVIDRLGALAADTNSIVLNMERPYKQATTR